MTNEQYILHETALVLDQLTRLGYWDRADDAEYQWGQDRTWEPDPMMDLPLSIHQSVRRINALL
jgi:hypothetical protein